MPISNVASYQLFRFVKNTGICGYETGNQAKPTPQKIPDWYYQCNKVSSIGWENAERTTTETGND